MKWLDNYWFKHYTNKHMKTGGDMIYILIDARFNKYCSESVIERLAEWYDKRLIEMLPSLRPYLTDSLKRFYDFMEGVE